MDVLTDWLAGTLSTTDPRIWLVNIRAFRGAQGIEDKQKSRHVVSLLEGLVRSAFWRDWQPESATIPKGINQRAECQSDRTVYGHV